LDPRYSGREVTVTGCLSGSREWGIVFGVTFALDIMRSLSSRSF
jgi:hypothetical protein